MAKDKQSKGPYTLELKPWRDERFPPDHPLHNRWTLGHEGKPVLTFATREEAMAAAKKYSWIVRSG